MKKCTKCKIEKPESEFAKSTCLKSGLRSECRACNRDMVRDYQREYQKRWRKENPEKAKILNKKHKENRKEKSALENKRWHLNNKDKVSQRNKKKRQTNPMFKMKANLVSRTSTAFKTMGKGKPVKTTQLLGTTYDVVKKHIEQQFKENMTWNNYGKWHIDHIIPLASARDIDELIALCHYSNLQPLWAKENQLKSNKLNFELNK